MGYNGTHVIENFIAHAGQQQGWEPARGKAGKAGRERRRFPDGRGSSLFYERDRQGRITGIQSYGSWFTLARLQLTAGGRRKRWILNGDLWPSSGFGRTNEHNATARMAAQASGTSCVIIPFAAIRAAGIDIDSIVPVDVQPDRREYTEHTAVTLDEVPEDERSQGVWRSAGVRVIPPDCPDGSDANPDFATGGWDYGQQKPDGNWVRVPVDGPAYDPEQMSHEWEEISRHEDRLYHWKAYRHWLGESLFRASYRVKVQDREVTRRRLFLAAFDTDEPHPLFFMAELPAGARPATIAEARDALKPDEVRAAEQAGTPVLRHGDLFVIAEPGITERELRTAGGELVPFSRPEPWSQERSGRFVNDSHTATRAITMPDRTVYVRGIMRHRPAGRRPDHRNLELWDRQTWGRIVPNTVPRSFDDTQDTSRQRPPRAWSLGGNVD